MSQVVCTHCDAINRVAEDRDARAAKCGRCGQALFASHPPDIAGAKLERQVAKSEIPVLVDVWAPWCGPCRVMGPEFEKASAVLEPRIRMVKLNSDENQDLSGRLGIRGIPTMILFRNGHELARVSGAMSASQITSWVNEAVARS